MIRNTVGICLNILGLGWGLGDRILCGYLCNHVCQTALDLECSLILLFVAIIFVVSGASLILTNKHHKKSTKKLITFLKKIS